MKKKLLVIVAIIAAAVAAGIGTIVFININDAPAVVVEQTINSSQPMPATDMPATPTNPVLVANFIDADIIHKGSGSVRMTNTSDGPVLSFGEEFQVTNGPDLYVYLSLNGPGEDLGEFASLGRLKSATGAQSYNAPDNFADYKTVVIWCRAAGITFATAELMQ